MKPGTIILSVVLILGAAAAIWSAVMVMVERDARYLLSPPEYVHPKPTGFSFGSDPQQAHGAAFSSIEIATPRRQTLRGWLIPAAESAAKFTAVLVHGRAGDRSSLLFLLPVLRRLGGTVVTMDLSENGLSDGAGRGMGLGMNEADDIDAVIAWLAGRDHARIILAGASLGATAAVLAGARNGKVAGVIADSTIASFELYQTAVTGSRLRRLGLNWVPLAGPIARATVARAAKQRGLAVVDAVSVVDRLAPRPLLLVHGDQDSAVALSHAQALLAKAGPTATLLTIEGANHVGSHTQAATRYERAVADLVAAALQRPKPANDDARISKPLN